MSKPFGVYHDQNPQIYKAFERVTIETIGKGFKNYGSKGIFEILRWQTGVTAKDDPFKVNNNYTPDYARLFEERNPQHKGFFFTRSKKIYND